MLELPFTKNQIISTQIWIPAHADEKKLWLKPSLNFLHVENFWLILNRLMHPKNLAKILEMNSITDIKYDPMMFMQHEEIEGSVPTMNHMYDLDFRDFLSRIDPEHKDLILTWSVLFHYKDNNKRYKYMNYTGETLYVDISSALRAPIDDRSYLAAVVSALHFMQKRESFRPQSVWVREDWKFNWLSLPQTKKIIDNRKFSITDKNIETPFQN